MVGSRTVQQQGAAEDEMNAQDMHLGMLKMLSATLAFSVGVGVTFSTVIVAVAAILS